MGDNVYADHCPYGVKKIWPRLTLVTLIMLVWSGMLPHPNLGVEPTHGSPLGKWLSRLVYWRSQADWHNGVSLDPTVEVCSFSVFRPEAELPPWSGWLRWLAKETGPSPRLAHQPNAGRLDQGKYALILFILNRALDLDPTFVQVYREKAFIEDQKEGSPQAAERTLLRALEEIQRPEDQVELLVDLCFLRFYRLKEAERVYQLAPLLEEEVHRSWSRLPPETQNGVRACLILVNRAGTSKSASGQGVVGF